VPEPIADDFDGEAFRSNVACVWRRSRKRAWQAWHRIGEQRIQFGDCDRICAYFSGYEASDGLVGDFVAAMRGAA
jgi:hypothetical protein